MIFTFREIFDMIVMIFAVGYIFSDLFDVFRRPAKRNYDPLIEAYTTPRGLTWEKMKFAIYAVGPALILHELGHKFIAMYYGLHAEFHAAYFWLVIALILKLMNFNFIFFVPAYVSIVGISSYGQSSLISFAGPAVNLLLWIGAWFLLKNNLVSKKNYTLVFLTSRVNMFLFIFNMIPIPMFDGFSVLSGIFHLFFG